MNRNIKYLSVTLLCLISFTGCDYGHRRHMMIAPAKVHFLTEQDITQITTAISSVAQRYGFIDYEEIVPFQDNDQETRLCIYVRNDEKLGIIATLLHSNSTVQVTIDSFNVPMRTVNNAFRDISEALSKYPSVQIEQSFK